MPSETENMLLRSQEVLDAAVATVAATAKTRAAFDRNVNVTDRKIEEHNQDSTAHPPIIEQIGQNTTTVVTSTSVKRKIWNTAIHVVSGTNLKLPVSYIVGSGDILHLSWRGYELYPGENFKEVGEAGNISTEIELMFSAQPGDSFSITVATYKE